MTASVDGVKNSQVLHRGLSLALGYTRVCIYTGKFFLELIGPVCCERHTERMQLRRRK